MAERVVSDEAKTRRRNQIAKLNNEGLSERQIAKRLGVSRTTVWNVKQEIIAAMPKRRGKRKVVEA